MILRLDDNMGKVDINIGVIRSVLSTCINENNNEWKCTSIFYTFISCKGKVCKLLINGGSSMNVVSNSVVDKLLLSSLKDALFL